MLQVPAWMGALWTSAEATRVAPVTAGPAANVATAASPTAARRRGIWSDREGSRIAGTVRRGLGAFRWPPSPRKRFRAQQQQQRWAEQEQPSSGGVSPEQLPAPA